VSYLVVIVAMVKCLSLDLCGSWCYRHCWRRYCWWSTSVDSVLSYYSIL